MKCVEPPPQDDAAATARSEVVFVGTVLAATEHGSVAQVDVEEVRKGPPQPATVTVQGVGPLSSGHRYFTPGERYVFYPRPLAQAGPGFNNQGGPFKEDACTPTRLFAPAEPAPGAAPASVRSDAPAPTTSTASDNSGGWSPPTWVLAVLGLPLIGLGLFLARRTRGKGHS